MNGCHDFIPTPDKVGKVFIIQDNGGRNFSNAKRFGELIPILERDVFPDDVKQRLPIMQKIIMAKLKDFNAARDRILLTGDPVAIFIVGRQLSVCEKVTLLKWDSENKGYFEVTVNL